MRFILFAIDPWVANTLSWLRLKTHNRWPIGSVPSRGSGWVRSCLAPDLITARPKGSAPTRYREVVLTRPKFEY